MSTHNLVWYLELSETGALTPMSGMAILVGTTFTSERITVAATRLNRPTPDRFSWLLCASVICWRSLRVGQTGSQFTPNFCRTPLNQSVQANNWDHHVWFKNPVLRRHFWWWKLKTVNLSSLRGLDPRSERSSLVGLEYFVQKIIVRRRGFWSATAKKKCFGVFDGYEHLP